MAKHIEDLIVELHFTVRIPKELVNKLLSVAEEMGHNYGDPGNKEMIRRLLIDNGVGAVLDVDPGFNNYQVHKVTA